MISYQIPEESEEQRENRVARDSWLPACREGWFACSMAYVDDFGLVRTRQLRFLDTDGPLIGNRVFRNDQLTPTWSVVGTEVEFKQEVTERCFHPFGCY